MIKNECEVKAGFDPAALFQVREGKNDVENKSGRDREALYSGYLSIWGRPRVIEAGSPPWGWPTSSLTIRAFGQSNYYFSEKFQNTPQKVNAARHSLQAIKL